jgi:hypothetical protein
VGNTVSSEIHEFKRELDLVRRPMNQNLERKECRFDSHHNNVASFHRTDDKFSVHVYSYDHITAPENSWDSAEKKRARTNHTEYGPNDFHGRWKTTTSSDNGRTYESSLQVNREDHLASLNDFPSVPSDNFRDPGSMTNKFSSTKANILYNADPFGYASSRPSANKNKRRFEAHEEAMRTVMPSPSTANRVDLIDTVRKKSRETICAIEGGHVDANVITVVSQVGGAAIHHATHTAGVVGIGSALVAGHVALAAVSAPASAVSFGVTRLLQRIAREDRLDRALSDRQQIKNRLSTTLPKARADRDAYLEGVDDALANLTKEHIVKTWDMTDRLLPRHLDKLAAIGPGGDSVAKKFGEGSGAATTSHELKYSILAETRLLNEVKAQVRNYGYTMSST